MRIHIDPHTLDRAEERGASEAEIRDVIETGSAMLARSERKRKAKVYQFKKKRHGRYYEHKRVEVIYVIEENSIITVTVYVFYGEWER